MTTRSGRRRLLVVAAVIGLLAGGIGIWLTTREDDSDAPAVRRPLPSTSDTTQRASATTSTTNDLVQLAVPADIDSSGETDVTEALNEFFATVRKDSVIQFPARSRYRVDGTVRFANKENVTVEGNRSTMFAATEGEGDRSHWRVLRSRDVRIRNLVVRGAHPNGGVTGEAYVPELEGQHGFRIESVRGLELDHVTVTDVYGDFVYIGRDQETRDWSERIWIHDGVFERNGRQGIAVTAGRDVVIERNNISYTRRATIDLEPNTRSGGAENIVIRENKVGPGRLLFVAAGKSEGLVRDVTIERNQLHGRPFTIIIAGTESRRRSNIRIVDNRSDSVAERLPIRLHNIDGLVLKGNVSPVASDADPFRLVGCTNAVTGPNDFGPPD